MRLDDPRLRPAGRRDPRPLGRRVVRRGVGRPPAVHRGRAARGRRDPARPSQGLPADLRAVRRAALLRGRRRAAGRPVAPGRRDRDRRSARTSGTSPVPQTARARRRPDPDQRLVVAGPRPRRDERGRPRDRDLVADADADLRPADDVVRDLLQPGRRGRVDLVLGRLRGHRADRRGRLSARRSTTRACTSVDDRAWPTSGASGSPCRCCATSGPSSRSASCAGSSPSGPGWPPTRPPTAAPRRASTSRRPRLPSEPIGFRPTASERHDRPAAGA